MRRLRAALYLGCAIAWSLLSVAWNPDLIERLAGSNGLLGLSAQKLLEHHATEWSRIRLQGFALLGALVLAAELYLARGWSLIRHWFAPARVHDLAVVRIVLVATQLWLLVWPSAACHCNRAIQLWLTQIDGRYYDPLPLLNVTLALLGVEGRPGADLLENTWLAGTTAGILALVGLLTPLSLLCLAGASTLLIAHGYSYGEYHHTDALMVLALWALALAPSGKALSLDAMIRRWWRGRGSGLATGPGEAPLDPFARWPLRLVQWLLALTYLDAGLAKLENAGLSWMNGYTLASVFAADGVHRGHALGVFLADQPQWLVVPAVLTLTFELGFVLLMLSRWWWVLVLWGVGMHLLIYVIHGPPFFQHVALYVCFLERHRAAPLRLGSPSSLRASRE